MAWLTLERTFAWEHPPTTLKACVALRHASLAARVWRAPVDVTALVAWVALLLDGAAVRRRTPARIRAATQMAVDDAALGSRTCWTTAGCSSRACASRGAHAGAAGDGVATDRLGTQDEGGPDGATEAHARARAREDVGNAARFTRTTETAASTIFDRCKLPLRLRSDETGKRP